MGFTRTPPQIVRNVVLYYSLLTTVEAECLYPSSCIVNMKLKAINISCRWHIKVNNAKTLEIKLKPFTWIHIECELLR